MTGRTLPVRSELSSTDSPGDQRSGSTVDVPQVPRGAIAVTVAGCVLLLGFFSRQIFLFSDDYMFLDDGRQMPFDWAYLSRILFTHFSPVTRTIDAGVAGLLPGRSWLVFATVMFFAACLVCSVATLLFALFGRTWLTIIGTVVLGTSLTLLPLTNWFTAAVNLIPALAGSTLSFAAMVFLIRGRSPWWALVAILSYTIAVLGWELTALVPGYALIWLLLFRARVTAESLRSVLRRTWWVWLTLAVIGGLTLLNYRLNYYSPAPAAGLGDLLHAMYISLFETTLPSIVGFHDPGTTWFTMLGTLLGAALLLYLVVVSFQRSGQAWRGWLFALAGWLVPCAALVLNRVGFWGVAVAEQATYFFLPTMLLVVGALEAFATAPRTVAGSGRWASASPSLRRQRIVALVVGLAVVAAAYLRSAPATIQGLFEFGAVAGTTAPERQYLNNFLESADQVGTDRSTFTVINSDVPDGLVPAGFTPYNRLNRVAALADPSIRFDAVTGTQFSADSSGHLQPVQIEWASQKLFDQPAAAGSLTITGSDSIGFDPARGACLRVTQPQATIVLPLGQTLTGDNLIVRTEYTVDRPTTARLLAGPPDAPFIPANADDKTWLPGVPGQLDTVSVDALSGVAFDSLGIGSTICLQSISVGRMVPAQ